jgi:hypothetical protein
MSESDPDEAEPPADDRDSGERTGADRLESRDEMARLRAENERLRNEYDRTRCVQYRQTAVGLAGVGGVALVAGALFPTAREVFVVLGGIGFFAAVLTWLITPERFLPADIAEGVYDAVHTSRRDLVTELDLADELVYVPLVEGDIVRLFVPQYEGMPLPEDALLREALVVPDRGDERGVTFTPTGTTLYREFAHSLKEPLADDPLNAALQLADGISDGLEVVDRSAIDVEVTFKEDRLSIELIDPPFGDADRFDHPVVSFVGIGLANATQRPVHVADVVVSDERSLVTYSWETTPEAGDAVG